MAEGSSRWLWFLSLSLVLLVVVVGVVVYGRLRVNQWETEKGEPRTSAEIDAFTIGHDLTRGQVAFTRLTRTQLDANDRLADPAIQDALHGEPGETGPDDEPDEAGHQGVVVEGGFGSPGSGSSGTGSSGTGSTGFGRRIEDADTDEYVVVNGG